MKNKFQIKSYSEGFSIWKNGLWILDASMFLKEGTVQISKQAFEIYQNDDTVELFAKDFKPKV